MEKKSLEPRINYLQTNMCTQCPFLLGAWCVVCYNCTICVPYCHCTVCAIYYFHTMCFPLSLYSGWSAINVQLAFYCHSRAYGPLSLYSMLFIVTVQCVIQYHCIGYSLVRMIYCHCLVCIAVNQIMPI